EIGKNMTLLECDDQILIIDCGMTFPDYEMPGIDIVIPDFSYVIENQNKIVGMIVSHGHEDHIGAIPYLLREINIPVYGTRLTLGLIETKLEEQNVMGDLRILDPGDTIKLGCFKVEAIRTTHSIADSLCFAINTPVGLIFHSGDFKIDHTPLDGEAFDFHKLAEIGDRGVKLMLCESTNAVRPGFTRSEKVVKENLEEIFKKIKGRIIIATFSSNVHRVQAIVDNAIKCGRKVAFSGRSMETVVNLAIELGYLKIKDGYLVDLSMTRDIPDSKLVIITTGSQGEPMSALSRISTDEHRQIKLKIGDTVILSSTPIPGNERTVYDVVNALFRHGANVIYSDVADIHVSGHACSEELKIMHSLIKPEYFMPVHGEIRHQIEHAKLAISMGMDEDNIFVLENGELLELTEKKAKVLQDRVQADAILVDGLGVGDVGNIVLRDRKMLSEAGLLIITCVIDQDTNEVLAGPDIKNVCVNTISKCLLIGITDRQTLKSRVKNSLSDYIYETTKRTPIILPVFMEV
ncbi:MAG: ribonuclease J, partial [Clostridia bacterium]|nr:ribonuclease J [Clostridia bacterium]